MLAAMWSIQKLLRTYIFLYLCIITGQNPETIDVSAPLDDMTFMGSMLHRLYGRDQEPPSDAQPMFTAHLRSAAEELTTKKVKEGGSMPMSEANQWLTDINIEDDLSD